LILYPTQNYPIFLYNDFFCIMDQIIKEIVLRRNKKNHHLIYTEYTKQNKINAKAAILDYLSRKIPKNYFD